MYQNKTYKSSLVPVDAMDEIVCGCTDPGAANYNPDANVGYGDENWQELCSPGGLPACAYYKEDPAWLDDVVPYGDTFQEACDYIGGNVTIVDECGADEASGPVVEDRKEEDGSACMLQVCSDSSFMQMLGGEQATTRNPQMIAGLKHAGVVGFDGAGGLVYDLGLQIRLSASRIPPVLSKVVEPETPKGFMRLLSIEGYIILGLIGYAVYIANKKGLFK